MQNLEIPIRLPAGIQGKHCAQHLVEFLLTHPGVTAATIDQQTSLLRMKFDSSQLSISEVQTIARELGADIGKQYHRCQMYLGKPRCRDCTELLDHELQEMPGVSYVSANPAASSIVVEYESDAASPAEIEQRIHRLGYKVGVDKVAMLTGDRHAVADTIAQKLHIDEVHAELLPEEKVQVVKKLLQEHGKLGMVGDGVNDAPALASATVGFATGAAGTDVALETADVVLMSDDLSKLPQAINLSHRSRRIIRQNLIFAMGVIAVLVCTAVLGQLKLPHWRRWPRRQHGDRDFKRAAAVE